jgi:signal transduction histidine kinase
MKNLRLIRFTRENLTTWLYALLTFGAASIVISLISNTDNLPPGAQQASVGAFILFASLWYAYSRWPTSEWITGATALIVAFMVGIALPEPYVSQQGSLSIFLPLVVALLITSRPIALLCIILPVAIILVRAGGVGAYREPQFIATYLFVALGMLLNHALSIWALGEAHATLRVLDDRVVERTADLQTALQQVEELSASRELLMHARADAILDLSHDLGNYLQYVMVGVDAIAMAHADDTAGVAHLEEYSVSAQIDGTMATLRRTARFVGDMKDAALLDRAALPLKIQPTSLKQLIQNVIQPLEQVFQQDAVILRCLNFPEVFVQTDAVYLARVIENVLGNALRYTRSSRTDGAVDVSVETLTDAVMIRIQDNGEGIAPDDLARLGERFVRVSAGLESGTGIGLSFCIALLGQMNGTLTIESPGLGLGASTLIRVPYAAAAVVHEEAALTSV